MKKHTVKIVVELYYDIENLPDYCTGEAAAKMVELALADNGQAVSSGHFDNVLGLNPVEICVDRVEEA